jgi:hypothetical protein
MREGRGKTAVTEAGLDDIFVRHHLCRWGWLPARRDAVLAPLKRHAVLINSATAVPRKIYKGFAGLSSLAMTWKVLRHTQPSCPAHAGHPVRRGFSIPSLTSLEYWITRMRG